MTPPLVTPLLLSAENKLDYITIAFFIVNFRKILLLPPLSAIFLKKLHGREENLYPGWAHTDTVIDHDRYQRWKQNEQTQEKIHHVSQKGKISSTIEATTFHKVSDGACYHNLCPPLDYFHHCPRYIEVESLHCHCWLSIMWWIAWICSKKGKIRNIYYTKF